MVISSTLRLTKSLRITCILYIKWRFCSFLNRWCFHDIVFWLILTVVLLMTGSLTRDCGGRSSRRSWTSPAVRRSQTFLRWGGSVRSTLWSPCSLPTTNKSTKLSRNWTACWPNEGSPRKWGQPQKRGLTKWGQHQKRGLAKWLRPQKCVLAKWLQPQKFVLAKWLLTQKRVLA